MRILQTQADLLLSQSEVQLYHAQNGLQSTTPRAFAFGEDLALSQSERNHANGMLAQSNYTFSQPAQKWVPDTV